MISRKVYDTPIPNRAEEVAKRRVSGPTAQLHAIAKRLRAETPTLTEGQALERAARENYQLYQQSSAEIADYDPQLDAAIAKRNDDESASVKLARIAAEISVTEKRAPADARAEARKRYTPLAYLEDSDVALTKLKEIAKSIVDRAPYMAVSRAEAMAQAARDNPDLYRQYQQRFHPSVQNMPL